MNSCQNTLMHTAALRVGSWLGLVMNELQCLAIICGCHSKIAREQTSCHTCSSSPLQLSELKPIALRWANASVMWLHSESQLSMVT